jgi:hypothetical protein
LPFEKAIFQFQNFLKEINNAINRTAMKVKVLIFFCAIDEKNDFDSCELSSQKANVATIKINIPHLNEIKTNVAPHRMAKNVCFFSGF